MVPQTKETEKQPSKLLQILFQVVAWLLKPIAGVVAVLLIAYGQSLGARPQGLRLISLRNDTPFATMTPSINNGVNSLMNNVATAFSEAQERKKQQELQEAEILQPSGVNIQQVSDKKRESLTSELPNPETKGKKSKRDVGGSSSHQAIGPATSNQGAGPSTSTQGAGPSTSTQGAGPSTSTQRAIILVGDVKKLNLNRDSQMPPIGGSSGSSSQRTSSSGSSSSSGGSIRSSSSGDQSISEQRQAMDAEFSRENTNDYDTQIRRLTGAQLAAKMEQRRERVSPLNRITEDLLPSDMAGLREQEQFLNAYSEDLKQLDSMRAADVRKATRDSACLNEKENILGTDESILYTAGQEMDDNENTAIAATHGSAVASKNTILVGKGLEFKKHHQDKLNGHLCVGQTESGEYQHVKVPTTQYNGAPITPEQQEAALAYGLFKLWGIQSRDTAECASTEMQKLAAERTLLTEKYTLVNNKKQDLNNKK